MDHLPGTPAAKLQLLARSIKGIAAQVRLRTERQEPSIEPSPLVAKQEKHDDDESARLRKLSRSIAHIAEQVKLKNGSRAGPVIESELENRNTDKFANDAPGTEGFDTLSNLLDDIMKESRRAETRVAETKPQAAHPAEMNDPDRFEQRIRELHAMAQSLTMQNSAANHNDPDFSEPRKKRSAARNSDSGVERSESPQLENEWINEHEDTAETSKDAARGSHSRTARSFENNPRVATITRFPRSRSDERFEPARHVHDEPRFGHTKPEPAQHRYAQPAHQFSQPQYAQPQPAYFPPAQPGPAVQHCLPAPYGQPWSGQPVWQPYPMPVQHPAFPPQPMVAPQYYGWPPHPSHAYPAHPGYAPGPTPFVQPDSAPPPGQPGHYHADPVTQAQFEEIRESLREFQGVLYDLSDQRTLRRA